MNSEIKETVNSFIELLNNSIEERYATFDLCYLYFRENRENLCGKNMEKSCYVLWSYLASWGMLRGSSFLLQKSPAYLKSLIEYIESNQDLFDIDVNEYTDVNIKKITHCYEEITRRLGITKERSITLVTKIMLGVFGCIPAYDRYFIETFNKHLGKKGFCSNKLTANSLREVHLFYSANSVVLDELRKKCKVKRFDGGESDYYYPIAKIIDMYGFQYSMKNSLKTETKYVK